MGKDRSLKLRIQRLNRLIDQGYEIDAQGRLVHRVVCRQAHGAFPKEWIVYHIDKNKKNNSPDNLIAMPRKLHDKIHALMSKKRILLNRAGVQSMVSAYVKALRMKTTKICVDINLSEYTPLEHKVDNNAV